MGVRMLQCTYTTVATGINELAADMGTVMLGIRCGSYPLRVRIEVGAYMIRLAASLRGPAYDLPFMAKAGSGRF
jgi:hypothetical protein